MRERGPENRRPLLSLLCFIRTAKRNIQAANRNEDSYGQEHHARGMLQTEGLSLPPLLCMIDLFLSFWPFASSFDIRS